MLEFILQFLALFCGIAIVFMLVGIGVLYLAWLMSQKDNGWER